jgi:DHA1 family multidrug/chloramphenicol efflux transport protein-like MFS transporter
MVQTKKRLLYFCLFFLLYEMAVYLSNDMIMPAMPQVVREFQSSSHAIGLSLSLYILGGSTLQIFLGPVADRIGKRKVMLAGNALFLAATLLVPFAQTITQFLAIRFFQGMGSCFIFIGYAAVHELLDDERAVKMTSLMGNTTVFAPLIGPVIGSAVITVMDWRAVFGIAFALGAVAWVGLFRTMPGPADVSCCAVLREGASARPARPGCQLPRDLHQPHLHVWHFHRRLRHRAADRVDRAVARDCPAAHGRVVRHLYRLAVRHLLWLCVQHPGHPAPG